jgi:hypothetical protein
VKTSTAGPREVPQLKAWELSPSTWGNIDGGPPGGAKADSLGALTINVETSTVGPRQVPEPKLRERSACGARPLGWAVNHCVNLGTNPPGVVRTYFTLTQVGHFY